MRAVQFSRIGPQTGRPSRSHNNPPRRPAGRHLRGFTQARSIVKGLGSEDPPAKRPDFAVYSAARLAQTTRPEVLQCRSTPRTDGEQCRFVDPNARGPVTVKPRYERAVTPDSRGGLSASDTCLGKTLLSGAHNPPVKRRRVHVEIQQRHAVNTHSTLRQHAAGLAT